MKLLLIAVVCCILSIVYAEPDQKQIKLEDIERDNIESERQSSKEIEAQPANNVAVPQNQYQVQYVNPQDIYVTPSPNAFNTKIETPVRYHLPRVHEGDRTYPAPARQSLIQPIIGGDLPIAPVPQPQYIYVQAQSQQPQQPQQPQLIQQQQAPVQYINHHPQQHHQQYLPQQPAYVTYPYATHQPSILTTPLAPVLQPPVHPTPQIYTYSHGVPSTSPPHYQRPADINIQPPTTVAPLPVPQEYTPKNVSPIPYIRKPTTFQQYYSPGLEYHYTEVVPSAKINQQPYPVNNHIVPVNPYQYQQQSYYQPQGAIAGIQHHYYPGYNTFVPNFLNYARQQQLRTYLQQQLPQLHHYQAQHQLYQQQQQHQQHQQQQQHILPYPSPSEYNTIKYSVPLPPYEHNKRSVPKASTSVAAPTTKLQATKN
jgi:hypothetical protein